MPLRLEGCGGDASQAIAFLVSTDCADDSLDYSSIAVEHECLGKPRNSPVPQRVAGTVEDDGERDLESASEVPCITAEVVGVNSNNRYSSPTILLPNFRKEWSFLTLYGRFADSRSDGSFS